MDKRKIIAIIFFIFFSLFIFTFANPGEESLQPISNNSDINESNSNQTNDSNNNENDNNDDLIDLNQDNSTDDSDESDQAVDMAPTISGAVNNQIVSSGYSLFISDDIALKQITVNGNSISNVTGLLNYELVLTNNGLNEIIVTDSIDQVTTLSVTVDLEKPQVVITDYTGNIENNIFSSLSVVVTDNDVLENIFLNGEEVENTLTTTDFKEGINTIVAKDNMGNEVIYTFKIDSKLPAYVIAPKSIGDYNDAYYSFLKITFSELLGTDTGIDKILLDGVVIRENLNSHYQHTITIGKDLLNEHNDVISVNDGVHTLTIIDKAFNELTYTFVIDTQAPIITNLKDDSLIISNNFYKDRVDIQIYDEFGLSFVEKNNKIKNSFIENDTKIILQSTKEKTHSIIAIDKAGNEALVTYYVDDNSPKISFNEEKTVGTIDLNLFSKLGIIFTDDFSLLDDIYFNGNLILENLNVSSFELFIKQSSEFIKDGKNSLEVCDTVSNCTKYTFIFDNTNPVITIPKNTVVMLGSEFDLLEGVSATDENDLATAITFTGDFDINKAGTYTVTYSVTDYAGNLKTKKRTIIVDALAPEITFNYLFENKEVIDTSVWFNDELKAIASFSDLSNTGISKVEICTYVNTVCTYTEVNALNSYEFNLNKENVNKVCIRVTDNNNKTNESCSDSIKIDTVKPEMSGLSEVNILVDEIFDFEAGITVFDVTSQIAGNIIINTNNLDLSTPGTYEVTYRVFDNAGNKRTKTRIVNVSAPTPEVSLSTDASVNEFGYVNTDINVTINGLLSTDTYKTCLTDTTCTPTTNDGLVINNESNSSKLCAIVTNIYNISSEVVCTDAYKLDKTQPTLNFYDLHNTINSSNWAKESTTIRLDITDDNDLASVSYCKTYTTVECTYRDIPETHFSNKMLNIVFNEENSAHKTCAIVTDKAGNVTTGCFDTSFGIDKTNPYMVDVYPNQVFELNEDVYASQIATGFNDNLSSPTLVLSGDIIKIEGFKTKLDTSEPGDKTAIYTLTDAAGNISVTEVDFKVVVNPPEVSLSTTMSANSNGWFNKDIVFTINGLQSTDTYKSCFTESTSCEPTSNNGLIITKESETSRMCISVTNEYGVSTDTICTNIYKLDKTKPTNLEILTSGTEGVETNYALKCPTGYSENKLSNDPSKACVKYGWPVKYAPKELVADGTTSNGWFISDVYITGNSFDNLSKIESNTLNYNVIDFDGKDITIVLTATDKAGNIASLTQTINVDRTAPTIDYIINAKKGAEDISKEGVYGWYTYNDLLDCKDTILGQECTGFSISALGTQDLTSQLSSVSINGVELDIANLNTDSYIQKVLDNITSDYIANQTDYVFNILAIDNAGLETRETFTVKFDQTAPVIENTSLGNTPWQNTPFTASDLGDLNGLLGDLLGDTFSNIKDLESDIFEYTINPTIIDSETSLEGTSVDVNVTNGAGLTSTGNLQVFIDMTKPVIHGIEDTEILVGSDFSINDGVYVTDNLSGVGLPISIPGLDLIPGIEESIKDLIGNKDYLVFVGDIGALTNISSLDDLSNLVTSIDTSKPGIYTVIYVAADNASNQTVITRQITVKADAPTIFIDFNLKDTSKPLSFDNFDLKLGLEDSTDLQLENFNFCMPGQEKCQLNIELNSNYIDTLIEGYIPENLIGTVPSLNSLYGVAEATNEDICLTVYTGIIGLEIKECVGYNPVADSYNDAMNSLKELEAKVQARIEAEIKKIEDARNEAINELQTEISKIETEIEELRNKLITEVSEEKGKIENEILILEQELIEVANELNLIRNNINSSIDDVTNMIEIIENRIEQVRNLYDKIF